MKCLTGMHSSSTKKYRLLLAMLFLAILMMGGKELAAYHSDILIAPTAVVDAGCNGGSNGSISIIVIGGTAPYTYSWSNGETTQNISGLAFGLYTVTVTDAADCSAMRAISVNEDSSLNLLLSTTPISCSGGNDGGINLNLFGGTGPYSFDWDFGSTVQNPVGLSAGDHAVTVTDATGCRSIAVVTLADPEALNLTAEKVDVDVSSSNPGSIDLEVQGGTAPYTYLWDNGQTTQDLTGLASGPYSVIVTDSNGCTAELSVTINELSVTLSLTSDVNCIIDGEFDLTMTFSEGVTGFETSDILVANGQVSNLIDVSSTTYIATIVPAADGIVTVDVAANAATSATGSSSAAQQFSIVYDSTPLTVAISSLASGMVSGPFDVTITFSAATKTFEKSDITIVNGTISNDAGSGDTYKFTLTPIDLGLVTIDVAACVAVDDQGNENLAADQFSIIYNNPPTDITLTPSSIAENSGADAIVGVLKTIDADQNDTHVYELVAGNGDADNATFTISDATLLANVDFDFETKSEYKIRIRTTDAQSGTFEKALSVTVTDEDEVVTSIDDHISGSEVHIFPNPASRQLKVDLSRFSGQSVDIGLHSNLGVMQFGQSNIVAQHVTLDLSTCKEGMYFLLITTAQSTIRKKVLIRR